MEILQRTQIGLLNKDSDTSSPKQITDYVNSAISAQTVALGGNDKDHADINNKAKDKGVVIGYNAETEDNSTVVVVGNGAKAKDWGTAIGHQSYSNLGVAFGADAIALSGHSIALGRFSYASADYAVQINGDKTSAGYVDKAINKEAHTLKFYNGSTNTTIVRADGTISANVAASCTGTATNANALNDGATITINAIKYNIGISEVLGKDGTTILSAMTLTLAS